MENTPPEPAVQFATEPPVEDSAVIATEPAPKLKGKARLLHGLQRISSSPSLAQLGRKRATSNPYGSRVALSSVSLASGRSYDNSYPPPSSGTGYFTAPTSVPATPGIDSPFFGSSYNRLAIQHREQGVFSSEASAPTSPLSKARPISRGNISPFISQVAISELVEDYFSLPVKEPKLARRENFDFWGEMPHEVKLAIFSYLTPKQLMQTSIVSKSFYEACFDGQLWTCFDASEFYRDIPAESVARIIVAAGPFVKDLNLRGCVQVEHYKRAEVVVKACKNLINATLEGCRNFQRSTLHSLLKSNERLANLNLTGLTAVTNGTCKIIANSCPSLEMFNVSWCTHMDARGIRAVILGCPKLRDLRAGEVRGFHNLDLAQDIFQLNRLEKLVLSGCVDITDEAIKTMIVGNDPEIDILTDRPIVPVRRLRHLDLSQCNRLTSAGVKALACFVPNLEGLQLSGCTALTDSALMDLLATTPRLAHLDLEEIAELTNVLLSEHLAKAPCAPRLKHLSISYCENLGDTGMLPVVRACTNLESVDMDNTKISDLVLAEATSMIRARSSRTTCAHSRPRVGLRMVVYDCQNVTWTGIREVLSRNSEVRKPTANSSSATYPTEIISMKCFYGWQMTVEEHTKRVLRGDLPAAARLERKWTEYMMANEEASTGGAGARRRRRRAREAQMLHADEEEGGVARSNGCAVM
ncbi:putative F-box/LRR-repeat protein 2 [Amylocarpus encephaloides]|uniref:F-box/LRR-repeat protein 2 n=1 Tax=Amylocarpus encephaloides TaxID=45428 RepID=A0A9P8CAC7_9HELO|nr:putative F-box/LRR-repeat protein 2 [Amylocarpus encephaloides]